MNHFFKTSVSGLAATNVRTFGHFGHASQTGPPDPAQAFVALLLFCAPGAQSKGLAPGERNGRGYGGAN